MTKFGITQEHYLWIKKIFNTYIPDSKIYVFGSRARGDYKKYSDLDLAVESRKPIQKRILSSLQEQFSESTIPFKIDLIEMKKIDPAFKKAIKVDLLPF